MKSEVELQKAASWWTAMLHRAKQMPTMDAWMNPAPPARALEGEEAEQRQAEHEDFVARMQMTQEGENSGD